MVFDAWYPVFWKESPALPGMMLAADMRVGQAKRRRGLFNFFDVGVSKKDGDACKERRWHQVLQGEWWMAPELIRLPQFSMPG